MSMEDQLLDNLNPEQLLATTHGNGPLLIVAGAGTGKTTAITKRIAWLIREGLARPDEILALTFTEKAAAEMEERVDRMLPYGYTDLWIHTFHAFAEKVLREHALEIGLPNEVKLLDTTAQWMLLRKNLDKFNLDYFRPRGNPTKFIHALLRHFSRAKDELVEAKDYLEYAESLKLGQDSTEIVGDEARRAGEIAGAYHEYEQLLLGQGATDFGGLINWTLKLFKERPNILELYKKKFKYILVDEFQDTNYAQYEMVKILSKPTNNLTVVGDDDQSIYKFRGASISNILEFKRDFPDSKEIFLIKNYRSKQNLLDLSYKFIQQNNPYRLEVKLGGGKTLSKKLQAANTGDGIIEHLHAGSSHEEARLVKEKILELKNSHPSLSWNDFAILVRANDHAGLFIRAFSDAGIPYEFFASRGLYTKPAILDLVAYFKLLDDFHESPATYRVLNFKCWDIGAEDITKLLYWANRKALSLFEAIKRASTFGVFSELEISKFERVRGFVARHSEFARCESVSKVLLHFLHDTGYVKSLIDNESAASAEALRNLNRFWKMVQDYETLEKNPTVKSFLQKLDLEIESGEEGALGANPDDGPESVKIMTVHAAKGLEFSYVFLVNLVDRRFPVMGRAEPIELPDKLVKEILPEGDIHLQEERRLFYVGCTRAKEGLFLTSAKDYGGVRAKKPSIFLTELGLVSGEPNKKGEDGNSVAGIIPAAELPKRTLAPFKLPNKLSFTQLKAFESCPLQYKFAHILKIPVRGKDKFSFGQTIHLTLQKFMEFLRDLPQAQKSLFSTEQADVKIFPDKSKLLEIYNQCWQDDWFNSAAEKERYYKDGQKLLARFYAEIKAEPPEVLSLEFPFTLKIGESVFKGKIDRLDKKPDGTVEIIDYKTGASKDLKNIEKDQLLIYQIAALEVLLPQGLIPGKPSALTFYYVEDGSKVSFLGTEEEIKKFKEKVKNTVKELENSSFAPTPSPAKCRFCDFKDICEARQM